MSFTPQPYQPSSDAHFTPTQGTYKELKPFRYWCQKVLPLVYDDSLSYYELLCKVVDYLNKTMEDVDTLHVDVDNLHDAYEELETDMNHKYTDISNWVNISYNDLVNYVNTYFENLDVQEEINNKLDDMAEDGSLTALISAYVDPIYQEYEASINTQVNTQNSKINVLESRMDSFSRLAEGSTTGDAELQDIRVAYSGKIFPTAGDAVRGQISNFEALYLSSLVSNNVIFHSNSYSCTYNNIDNYKEVIIGDINVSPNHNYVIFCGNIKGGNSSSRIRVYITYSDSSVQRVDLYANQYSTFKTWNGEITSAMILGIATNLVVPPTSGTAEFLNVYLFDGSVLNIKSIFGKTVAELDAEINEKYEPLYLRNFVNNTVIHHSNYEDKSYNTTGAYQFKQIATLELSNSHNYILSCGNIIDGNSTSLVRVYIEYADSSIQRVNAKAGEYTAFKTYGSSEITGAGIEIYATNGTVPSEAGVAKFLNIYVFDGSILNFKPIFGDVTELKEEIIDKFEVLSLSSFVSNNVIFHNNYTSCPYNNEQSYKEVKIGDIELASRHEYVIFCGNILGADPTGRVRVYIAYSDLSIQRVDVYANRFNSFRTYNGEITSAMILGIATNQVPASSGTAEFWNIYVFEGENLNFRSIFTKNNIPWYYRDHLSTKEATIREHYNDCAFDGDGLVFLTDTHYQENYFTSDTPTTVYNTNHSIDLIENIIEKCGINKIVFGGDLVNTASNVDTMLMYMSIFSNRFKERQTRLRYCMGNHEYYTGPDLGATEKPTTSELYGAGIKYNEDIILKKGAMDTYYFDNTVQKIRYFIVSCGRDTETTTAQIAWVLSQFLVIPNGYRVIIIGHAFLTDSLAQFRSSHKPIVDGLDAVKSKTSYVYNGVTYDYSNVNVEIVCIITGHTHMDGYLVSDNGILCICTTTDSYSLNCELVNGVPTVVPRDSGNANEQAFDVYQFDFTNKRVYCTRIGYGSNRTFDYENGTII